MLVEVIRKSDLFADPVAVGLKIFTGARFARSASCEFESPDGLQNVLPFSIGQLCAPLSHISWQIATHPTGPGTCDLPSNPRR